MRGYPKEKNYGVKDISIAHTTNTADKDIELDVGKLVGDAVKELKRAYPDSNVLIEGNMGVWWELD
tara:strand:- start:98 stop:295 length:198 start_codon:yes stop_codon:yes gene_type:complete